jgi:hypothetical protein
LQIRWAGSAAMRVLISFSWAERGSCRLMGTKMGASRARSLRVRSEYSTGGKAQVRRGRRLGRTVLASLPARVVLVRMDDGARMLPAPLVPLLMVSALLDALASLALF